MSQVIQSNVDIAKQIINCYKNQNFSPFSELVHENCTWLFPGKNLPWAGEFKGDEIYKFLEIIKNTLEFDYFEDKMYYQDENTVIVLCEEQFTVKSTGKKVFNKLAGFFEIHDGKVTKYCEYSDTESLVRGMI